MWMRRACENAGEAIVELKDWLEWRERPPLDPGC
jgi:hypothetical protein